jgi:tripartite-type tricarboxylate transporter receptor subunit TctC
VDIGSFSGVAAPAKTPPAIVERLNREFNAVLAEPETRPMFFSQGYEIAGGTSQEFARMLAEDVGRWSAVVKAANITFE